MTGGTAHGRDPLRRWPVCGAWVNLLDRDQLIDLLTERPERLRVVANHNLHSLHLVQADPGMREFYSLADAVHVDGRPVIALARLLGAPARACHLQTSIDFIMPLLAAAAARHRRVFVLGSRPGVPERFLAEAARRVPGLVAGGHHGHFGDDLADPGVQAAIRAFRPDLLLLGMGMPRQERWFLANRAALPPCTVMNLGAFMDYWVGERAMAPRWLNRIGLEWAWRLACEPRRLAHRYLNEPFLLIGPVLTSGRRILLPDRRSAVAGDADRGAG